MSEGWEAARDRLIVALDLDTPEEALAFASRMAGTILRVKVGSRLFLSGGGETVRRLVGLGFRVFLDLKFHDIPHQVHGSVAQAARLGCDLLTLHASGGTDMMKAAADAAGGGPGTRPRLLAVTVLTSLEAKDLQAVGVTRSPLEQVSALAWLSFEAGMDGVVCSPQELPRIRPLLPSPFLMVTPGIRASGAATQDQRRSLSASEATRGGADHLVVGRPLLQAPDPLAAAHGLLEEIALALEVR